MSKKQTSKQVKKPKKKAYKVEFAPAFKKQLGALPKSDQKKIFAAIEKIRQDPKGIGEPLGHYAQRHRIIMMLSYLWEEYPNHRFGQMFVNYLLSFNTKTLFALPDNELEAHLKTELDNLHVKFSEPKTFCRQCGKKTVSNALGACAECGYDGGAPIKKINGKGVLSLDVG